METLKNLLKHFIKPTTVEEFSPHKTKTMNLNRILGKDKTIKIILGIGDFLFYYCVNYIANFLNNMPDMMQAIKLGLSTSRYKSFWNGFYYLGTGWFAVFLFEVIFIVIFDITFWYKFKISYSEEYFNVGQKGTARWTTVDEIKQQYKEIPDRGNEIYQGQPGTIVAHFDGKLYIDTNICNNLILGITRSGKNEMYVYKSIDVYSRAEVKHSMIVNDPKLENYKSSKATLIQRGYEVWLLNLIEPLLSMGWNALSDIVKKYKSNQQSVAYGMARSFTYSIFHREVDGKAEPIWANTATDLFTALIIAVVTDELKLDEDLNEIRIQAYTNKVNEYKNMTEEEKSQCDKRIKEDLSKQKDPIEDPKLKGIPESYPYKNVTKHEEQISIFNIIILFSELTDKMDPMNPDNPTFTGLDDYFRKRDAMDLAKLKFATIKKAGDRTKGSIYTNMMSYLGAYIDESIAKMTAESTINLEDIGFGNKPVAVFLGIPDFDKSNYFIASAFMRQVYYVLAEKASKVKSQACKIPVRFICDECGNQPAIEDLGNFITVSNGRKIGFDLYFQSYAQVYNVYKDNAQTIIDNCANEIYIKSGDPETLERFSKMLGNETYIDIQRNGEKISLGKTFMETPTEKPLMRPDDLKNLLEGECIIYRKLKRKDKNGNDVIPHPIFNSAATGTQFLYRYQYLTDTFPNPTEIDIYDINDESRQHIDLKKLQINVREITEGIDQQIRMKTEHTLFKESPNFKLVDEILRNNIGENYINILEIQENYTWSRVLAIIEESAYIKEAVKMAIRSAMSA